MRVRIGLALLAIFWPLLATAAPAMDPVTVPACCRRDGTHHCMLKMQATGTSVSDVCPFTRAHRQAMATHWARPINSSARHHATIVNAIICKAGAASFGGSPLRLSSRAPPARHC